MQVILCGRDCIRFAHLNVVRYFVRVIRVLYECNGCGCNWLVWFGLRLQPMRWLLRKAYLKVWPRSCGQNWVFNFELFGLRPHIGNFVSSIGNLRFPLSVAFSNLMYVPSHSVGKPPVFLLKVAQPCERLCRADARVYVHEGLWAAFGFTKPPKGGVAAILQILPICQWRFAQRL